MTVALCEGQTGETRRRNQIKKPSVVQNNRRRSRRSAAGASEDLIHVSIVYVDMRLGAKNRNEFSDPQLRQRDLTHGVRSRQETAEEET